MRKEKIKMNFDDFDIGPQIDESFSWYDYELAFGNIDVLDEEVSKEDDDYIKSSYAVV